jgi:tetratricopeptide (TPR) repeat protein
MDVQISIGIVILKVSGLFKKSRLGRKAVILVLAAASQFLLGADKLPKPDRIPAPPTPEQATLIREGVALHDSGNYEGAITKYKQVLAENPWEVNALHELAFTQFVSKDYEGSLATSRLGAQCRSQLLTGFYVSMANALDELGERVEAIDIYRAAIKQNPKVALLHYNLAVSLRAAGKQADAKAAVEQALRCNPNHASSHATLAALYQEMGYRIPAILAYSRFLALEPDSARSMKVLPTLLDLLTKGVGKGKQANEINIFVSGTPKKGNDEGDFMGVEMMMSITLAADLMTGPEQVKKEPESPFQKLVALYASMGESIENSKPKGGFAAMYYAPYFAALTKAGYTEAFAAVAFRAANLEGSADWAKTNVAQIEAFDGWSRAYSWPAN